MCQSGVVEAPLEGGVRVRSYHDRVWISPRTIFHAHGADERPARCRVQPKADPRQAPRLLRGSAALSTVALEACGGAHHWARELRAMGHDVRLIPPAYVKPFVKRHKNDAVDAEAICEAAQRPSMRFVSGEERGAAGRRRDWYSGPRDSGWCGSGPSSWQCGARSPDRVWLGRAQGDRRTLTMLADLLEEERDR